MLHEVQRTVYTFTESILLQRILLPKPSDVANFLFVISSEKACALIEPTRNHTIARGGVFCASILVSVLCVNV